MQFMLTMNEVKFLIYLRLQRYLIQLWLDICYLWFCYIYSHLFYVCIYGYYIMLMLLFL